MIAPVETKTYTLAEYLDLELAAETRSEYRNGAIVPMTVSTPNHSDIAGNLYISLRLGLKHQPYEIFHADQRLWIPALSMYTYPDVMVLSKPLELQTGRTDTVVNPCAIAEVLSQSTQNYDRVEKFAAYRTIPTLRDYLLIDQYHVHVEHYVKTAEHQWLFSEYQQLTDTLTLDAAALQLQLADLYENIDFTTD